VGDVLQCTGAAGLFTLPPDMTLCRQVLLFAAGIGITPLFSLLKTLLIRHPDTRIVLIYSNRSEAEAVFRGALKDLQRRYGKRLQIEWLFSDARDLSRARLSKWLMPALLRQYVPAERGGIYCFTCGPAAYMWLVALLMEEAGIPRDHIRKEIFVPHKEQVRTLPPDTEPHRVTLQMAGTRHALTVRYPETVLQAARKAGIAIPYSCEAGQCGSCVARCTEGNIWLSRNEVLTRRELDSGLILTCVGYPVGGDAVIEL
jgi:ring-1,2-phenylacetyl-CoA epoxidase subunit PaaE